jgi:hypothetical protein
LAARDFSRAGETFIDYKGLLNEIPYSIVTPVGYHAHVSAQALKHIEKHPFALPHKHDIPYILNNPDLVTPNPDNPKTHIFYKSLNGKRLLAIAVQLKDEMRFVATMCTMLHIKGFKENRLSASEFLYLRGGFKWKKWK